MLFPVPRGSRRRGSTEEARRRRALRPWDLASLEPRCLLATIRWTGTQNNLWNIGRNWDLNRAPAAGDDLVFPTTGSNTTMVANINNLSVNSITFDKSYTLTGTSPTAVSKLIINRTNTTKPGIRITSATATVNFRPDALELQKTTPIDIPTGSTLNFLGTFGGTSNIPLTGAGGFTKAGGGNFVFATQGTGAYAGKPSVTGGPITIGTSTSLPTKLTLTTGASMSLGGQGIGAVSFGLPDFDSGGGSIYLESAGSSLTVNGTIDGGSYSAFQGGCSLTLGTVTGGASFYISTTDQPITVRDPGNGRFDLNGSTLTVDTQGADATFTGTLNGAVLEKRGAGTLTLGSKLADFYGDVALQQGGLRLGADAILSRGNGLYMDSGTTLDLNGHDLAATKFLGTSAIDNPFSSPPKGAGSVALNNGSLTIITPTSSFGTTGYFGGTITGNGGIIKKGPGTLYLGGGTYGYTGTTRVDEGGLFLGEFNSAQVAGVQLAGRVQVAPGASLGVNTTGGSTIGSLAGAGPVALGRGLAVGLDNTSSTYSGVLSTSFGGASLVKLGTGTMTLSNTGRALSGPSAVVNAGALRVDSSSTTGTTYPVQVNSGGTLQGAGGPIAIATASGGTIRPGGDAPGTLRFPGNLTLAAGSTLAVRLNSTNITTGYDRLVNTSGRITVTGARLSPTLNFLPRVNDAFTIVSGLSVVGRFAGLPDGGTLTVNGIPLRVFYTADSVVLRRDPAETATTLGVSPLPSVVGRPVTLTATVTPASFKPAGIVTFFDGTRSLGSGTLDGSGVARLTTSSLAVGNHSLSAAFASSTGDLPSTSESVLLNVRPAPVAGDYLGTGAAQYAVFRPTSETYIVRGLGALQVDVTPGRDIPAQYDFAGDGKVDQVAYRFDAAQYFGFRSDLSVQDRQFGTPGLSLPVSGTYDGPGRLVLGLYNPDTGTWAIDLPTPGGRVVDFGRPYQDIPAPAAYEGGGQARIAFFRPGDAGGVDGDSFYVLAPDSLNNYRVSFTEPAVVAQGFVYRPGDIPAPADYDGVGRDQFAVYRPSTGQFFILRVPNIFNASTWTLRTVTLNLPGGPRPGDVPASQDYDGTGRASPTAFRPSSSTFHSIRTTDGAQRDIQFGQPGLDVAAAGPLLYRLSALFGTFAGSGGYPAEVTTTGGGTYIPRGAGGTTRAASLGAPATTGGAPTPVTTAAPGPAAAPATRSAPPAARAATTAGARTPRVHVATPAPPPLEVLTFGRRRPTTP